MQRKEKGFTGSPSPELENVDVSLTTHPSPEVRPWPSDTTKKPALKPHERWMPELVRRLSLESLHTRHRTGKDRRGACEKTGSRDSRSRRAISTPTCRLLPSWPVANSWLGTQMQAASSSKAMWAGILCSILRRRGIKLR